MLHFNIKKTLFYIMFISAFACVLGDIRYINAQVYRASSSKRRSIQFGGMKDIMKDAYIVRLFHSSVVSLKRTDIPKLPLVEELTMTLGNLQVMTPGCFQNLPQLKKLDVKQNNLKKILKETFKGVPLLETLVFHLNHIKEIEDHAFSNMRYLEEIDLSHNVLRAIGPKWFHQCGNLKTLDLSHNSILEIPDGAFRNVRSLTTLALRGNKINHLGEHAVSDLQSLHELDLGWNVIDTIPDDFFVGLDRLDQIGLRTNSLPCLSENVLKSIEREGVTVDFVGNKIGDDCKNVLNDFTKRHPHITLKYSKNH